MKLPLFQIDAFADKVFEGNPAAVCPLDDWLPSEVMQSIAAENNLAETAFFVGDAGRYALRWFTPVSEVDLCGHATLAAAKVVFDFLCPELKEVHFQSRSGLLKVTRKEDGLTLDFPAQPGDACSIPDALIKGLGKEPQQCFKNADYMAVFAHESEILSLEPDFRQLCKLDLRGVIATAPGRDYDFVSRFFAPNYGIDEDPVTGSAHCMLTPYWANRLGKNELLAKQLSNRTGMLGCRLQGARVFISGNAVTYMQGSIII